MEALDELQDTPNIKSNKANKFWQILSDQHKVKFKNQVYLSKKEAYTNKWKCLGAMFFEEQTRILV